MLKVKNSEGEFKIYWRYSNPQELPSYSTQKLNDECSIITKCYIAKITKTEENTELEKIVATASVTKYYTDPYNKNEGRRRSLNKALLQLYPNIQVPEKLTENNEEKNTENLTERFDAKIYNMEQESKRSPFRLAYNLRNWKTNDQIEKEEIALLNNLISQDKFIEKLANNEEFLLKLNKKVQNRLHLEREKELSLGTKVIS